MALLLTFQVSLSSVICSYVYTRESGVEMKRVSDIRTEPERDN